MELEQFLDNYFFISIAVAVRPGSGKYSGPWAVLWRFREGMQIPVGFNAAQREA